MKDAELFQLAMGLVPPWHQCAFDKEQGRLGISIGFARPWSRSALTRRKPARSENYVSLFVDLERSQVVFACEGGAAGGDT